MKNLSVINRFCINVLVAIDNNGH